MTIDLGDYLEQRIDEALDLVNQRNPQFEWTKEQLIMMLIGRGLDKLFRQHVRREVNLKGVYRRMPGDDVGHAMIVTNISRGGVRFTMLDRCKIRLKEVLDVEFVLTGEKNNSITKRVLVKHIKADQVGAEFCEFSDMETVVESNTSGKAGGI